MKKAILAIILVVALGCGIFIGFSVYQKDPKNAIIGTWNNDEVEGLYYEFNKDGTMSGKAEILSATAGFDGTYTIDKEAKTLSITYQITGSLIPIKTDYNLTRTFEFTKEGKLILTDEDGNVSTFTKAEK